MSNEQQDAEIGKMVRERADARRQEEILRNKARELQSEFRRFAGAIGDFPFGVTFDMEPLTTHFEQRHDFSSTLFNLAPIQQLCRELRDQIIKRQALDESLKHIGLP